MSRSFLILLSLWNVGRDRRDAQILQEGTLVMATAWPYAPADEQWTEEQRKMLENRRRVMNAHMNSGADERPHSP